MMSIVEEELLGIKVEVQKFPSIEEFHTFTIQGDAS